MQNRLQLVSSISIQYKMGVGCISEKRQTSPYKQQLVKTPLRNLDRNDLRFMNQNVFNTVNNRSNIFEGIVATYHGQPRNEWVPIDSRYLYKGQWSIQNNKHGQGFIYDLAEHSLLVCCFYENNLIKIKGRKFYPNITEYFGQINSNYERDGNGILTGKLFRYQGEFKNNLYEGRGKLQEKDIQFEGTFEKGLKKEGKQKTPLGVYEGPFENNKQEGFGKFVWLNGGRYEGPFHLGKIHGKGKLYDKENNYCGKRTFEQGKLVF